MGRFVIVPIGNLLRQHQVGFVLAFLSGKYCRKQIGVGVFDKTESVGAEGKFFARQKPTFANF